MNRENNIDEQLNENTRLVAAVLHLKCASDLLNGINNEIGSILLQTADAIISDYKLKTSEIDEIKNIEKEISSNESE